MRMTGNTILITGGASGIGRGLAEAFHALGNRVVIAGRRQTALDEVVAANPGMASLVLDIADPAAIEAFAKEVIAAYPALNVLINNAGIMTLEKVTEASATLPEAEAMIVTNLLGTIRMSATFLPHLMSQENATLVNVTSGLAFTPHTHAPTYSATKAGIHSYTMALRRQLRDAPIDIVEIVPPYVQTELISPAQRTDPNAMPLAAFIAETMDQLGTGAPESVVERAKGHRYSVENGTIAAEMEALAAM